MTTKDQSGLAPKLTLISLTWPIFIELSLHMLMANMDTFMLSQYSDKAVAAVGVSNQINALFNIMFGFVAAGTTILVSRHLGAGKPKDAYKSATTSLSLNLFFGLAMSIVMVTCAVYFLRMLGLPEELMEDGRTYLSITGASLVLQALLMTSSAAIKSYGLTRNVMLITVGMNILNLFGNAISLYGWFGLPVFGVKGVAITTIISRSAGLTVMLYLFVRTVGRLHIMDLFRPIKRYAMQVLKIGVPAAGENLSYSLSQLVITSFIATMGVVAMVTRVYTFNIIFFITVFSMAITQGTQILVSRYVGAKDYDHAYQRGIKSLGISILIALGAAGVFNLIGGFILDLFTDDPDVIEMGRKLLLLSFLLEPGRAFNVVLIGSLRAVGDVNFPVMIGVIFMWGLAVPLAYLLGIHWSLGLFGIFITFILDEWTRGLIMLHRWRKRKWLARLP